jgi:hypothetical protein
VAGTVIRITTSSTGDGSNGNFVSGRFTPDGTGVVFATASNLGPTDTNNLTDVYSHDLTTGENHLVSVSAAGPEAGTAGRPCP